VGSCFPPGLQLLMAHTHSVLPCHFAAGFVDDLAVDKVTWFADELQSNHQVLTPISGRLCLDGQRNTIKSSITLFNCLAYN